MKTVLSTAFAPIFWGTTYIITTELLPQYSPLFVGLIRSLPIGILLLIYFRQVPSGIWWWRTFVLGGLNIGLFFALLFVATFRLPGGIVATIGAIQPLIVLLLVWVLTGVRPLRAVLVFAGLGILGVALLVITPQAQLDLLGVLAAFGGTLSMAAGVTLTKIWERPVSLTVFTGWQLVAGGLILGLLVLLFDRGPVAWPTGHNLLGFGWLIILNTGLGYMLWFNGLGKLGAAQVSFLGLLSPIVAMLLGYLFLNQTLSLIQISGVGLILISIVAVQFVSSSYPFKFRIRASFG